MKNKNICTYLLLNTEVLKKIVWKYAEFIETGGTWKSWNHTQWLIWHHPQNHSKNLLTCSIPEPVWLHHGFSQWPTNNGVQTE